MDNKNFIEMMSSLMNFVANIMRGEPLIKGFRLSLDEFADENGEVAKFVENRIDEKFLKMADVNIGKMSYAQNRARFEAQKQFWDLLKSEYNDN